MQKHHIVQDKYLAQWAIDGTKNHLNVYIISENRCDVSNTKSKLFWRKDFNILDDNGTKSYIPENVTATIDGKGIEAIRKIDTKKKLQLSGKDRSCVAFYVALQYIRTPRFREESNKMVEANIKYFMRQDMSSLDKIKTTKKELLKEKPKNKYEEDMYEEVRKMTNEEIQKKIFEAIHSDNMNIVLTKEGHSKYIFKVDRYAKDLFEVHWLFLIAPKGTSFTTSDNPCFTIGPKIMNGLLSPHSLVFFPLRPDLCICIKPKHKTQVESFMSLNKRQVRDINKLILAHAYNCLVAKDKSHLEHLTDSYDHKNHKKSRDVVVSEKGPYIMFNLE